MQNSNKSQNKITLIGMMGCGKSCIGNELAQKLNLPCHDSDKIIEQQLQTSIAETFASKGEDYFRTCEADTITKLLNQDKFVIALGGGAYIQDQLRQTINQNSISIYLNVPIEILWNRVKDSPERPLVQKGYSHFVELLDKRSPIYQSADISIVCGSESKSAIVQKIISALQTA